MTYVRKYTKEQLIALARKRGIYPPGDATDEDLKVVERRLSAERGWLGPPQPEKEWHTPGWLREKGGPSHFHSGISTLKLTEEQEAKNAALRDVDHSHIGPLRVIARYAAGRRGARRRG